MIHEWPSNTDSFAFLLINAIPVQLKVLYNNLNTMQFVPGVIPQ